MLPPILQTPNVACPVVDSKLVRRIFTALFGTSTEPSPSVIQTKDVALLSTETATDVVPMTSLKKTDVAVTLIPKVSRRVLLAKMVAVGQSPVRLRSLLQEIAAAALRRLALVSSLPPNALSILCSCVVYI